MSTGKIVLGAVAGLAVGAVLGVLFAPEKGSTTRKQIKKKSTDYVDKLKSKYSDLADSVKSQFDNVKDDAMELADKGKAKYNEVKKDASHAAADLKL